MSEATPPLSATPPAASNLERAILAYYGEAIDQTDIDPDDGEAAVIERIIAALAAARAEGESAEREICAMLADVRVSMAEQNNDPAAASVARTIARAIRLRNNPKEGRVMSEATPPRDHLL